MIKLLVVGDGGVGKTCLLIRYATGKFPEEYVPTVLDNPTVTVQVSGIGNVSVGLCDTAGNADYDRLRPLSYPSTDVVLICFSISEPSSLENVAEKWIQEVRHHLPNGPVILVGCQKDLRTDLTVIERLERRGYQRPLAFDEGMLVAVKIGAVEYLECSSLTEDGVAEVFKAAISTALFQPVQRRRKLKIGGGCVVF
ncbi:small GTPase Cdc42 [Flagelloscypha sp. PMI_526]|nr:small GTPase Cdc42 [Flagelloscypha sp. PMI_526]